MARTIETSCLTVLEAESLRTRFQTRLGLPESHAGEFVPGLSPSFWWPAASLWHCLACRLINLISAFNFTWYFPCVRACVCARRCACVCTLPPFYEDTSHIGLGSTLMTFPINYLCKDCYHMKSHYDLLRLGLWHVFFGRGEMPFHP